MAIEDNKEQQVVNKIKYNRGRVALMLLWIASALSLPFFLVSGDYFPFSSFFISVLIDHAGKYMASIWEFHFYLFILISVVGVYFFCWLKSKKNYIWLIVALIIYIVDMFLIALMNIIYESLEFSFRKTLIDWGFHIFVICEMVRSVIYAKKAK